MGVKRYVTDDQSYIQINKLFELDIEIFDITIEESMMDGSVTLIHLTGQSEAIPCKVNDVFTGTLYSGMHGCTWNFECFVYDIKFHNHSLKIDFACCKQKFLKDNVVAKYTSIDGAIKSTWQLARLDKVQSPLQFDENYSLHQQNESNYQYCKRLCFAYKYDTIYGFLINGLKFVDLNAWTKEVELTDKVEITLQDGAEFEEPKLYDKDVKICDYNHKSPEYERDDNHQQIWMNGHVITVDKHYAQLHENHEHNIRLLDMKRTNKFHMNYLHGMSVGTYVQINSDQLSYKKSVITSRVITMHKTDCHVTYKICSIEI